MEADSTSAIPAGVGTRISIWLITLVTVALAPALNFGIAYLIGIDLASFTFYTFIPVGTFALCALACSGFLLGGSRTIYHPDTIDLVFLMAASIGAVVLGFALDYLYVVVAFDASPTQLGGFRKFVYTSITEARITSYSRRFGTSPPTQMGEAGLLVMLVRVAGAAAVAKAVHSSVVSRAVNLS